MDFHINLHVSLGDKSQREKSLSPPEQIAGAIKLETHMLSAPNVISSRTYTAVLYLFASN